MVLQMSVCPHVIFGLTKENQIWRVKTNEKLDKLIKHKNIINHIKAQRLSWFVHVQRMPDTRTVNTLRTGSFKLFKRPFPGFLTILTL